MYSLKGKQEELKSFEMVNGDSLRIKHVAVLENDDVRHVHEELADVDLSYRGKKYFQWDWKDLTIAQTTNTEATCRLCLGHTGYVYHIDEFGIYAITKCPKCKGTKRMKIK